MDLGLENREVLIVGGAAGIGAACVQRFLNEGARVIVWDRQYGDNLPETVRQFTCDVTQPDSVKTALEGTLQVARRIDCLVHTAAIGSGAFGFPFNNVPLDRWRHVLDVNIFGMATIAYAVSPIMIAQGCGSMVFLSSVAGQIGSQTDPPYSASKAANLNFAVCLARDLATHGIRVNSICPGMVQTALNRSVWQAWYDQTPEADRRDYETWAMEKIQRVVPLGRWQTPDDIADAILFLSSQRASQITGQALNVDGGFVMR